MQIIGGRVWIAAVVVLLFVANVSFAEDGNLAQLLEKNKWDRLLGTWVDAETGGANSKTTYAWKLKDRALEVTSVTKGRTSIQLMGRSGQTGQMFSMGLDSDGGSSIGEYSLDSEDLVLDLLFTSGEGIEGSTKIRHHFKDDDTVVCTIEGPRPFSFTLVRLKE